MYVCTHCAVYTAPLRPFQKFLHEVMNNVMSTNSWDFDLQNCMKRVSEVTYIIYNIHPHTYKHTKLGAVWSAYTLRLWCLALA